MLSIKENKLQGTIVLNTILDPITKSKTDGRHLHIKNFQIRCDGLDITKLENKARGQIGIEVRAKVREWSDTAVRSLSNTVVDWDEWFTTKTSIDKMDHKQLASKIGKSQSKEDIAKLIAELQSQL